MSVFINLSAYRFTTLDALPDLRARLKTVCKDADLKGTILLSPEGINLFVAGTRAHVDQLMDVLRQVPGLAGLEAKESESETQPFNRMLVKIKREIIAFGIEGIDPVNRPTPKLPPALLKQWLDEGRPVTLLDTRNGYEIRMGTFRGATSLGIEHFREFPDAVQRLPAELKTTPVVMFCTGGIRCEKAGPLLEREGFQSVHQLEGGILKYFELCGGSHYEGECFVFDKRVGVGPDLRKTGSALCFACQMPLTVDEQKDVRYVPDISCPHCHGRKSVKKATPTID